jgi:hypothetical protein
VDEVRSALARAELEPQALVLEITEAAVVHDPASAAEMLAALRAMGSGSSSTTSARATRRSRCSTRSRSTDEARPDLVMRIGDSGGAVPLVRAIVDLGRALGSLARRRGDRERAPARRSCDASACARAGLPLRAPAARDRRSRSCFARAGFPAAPPCRAPRRPPAPRDCGRARPPARARRRPRALRRDAASSSRARAERALVVRANRTFSSGCASRCSRNHATGARCPRRGHLRA